MRWWRWLMCWMLRSVQGSAMLRMDFEESGSGLPKNRSFPQSDMASFPQSDMAGSFGARGQDVRKVGFKPE